VYRPLQVARKVAPRVSKQAREHGGRVKYVEGT